MYFEFHQGKQQAWAPTVDVCERTEEIIIIVEMPGVRRQDVQISWNEGVLTISGHKRQQPDSGVACYHCVERAYGQFRREIAVNVPVEHEKARAELRDGLMRIYLPKRTSQPGPSRIPIVD